MKMMQVVDLTVNTAESEIEINDVTFSQHTSLLDIVRKAAALLTDDTNPTKDQIDVEEDGITSLVITWSIERG